MATYNVHGHKGTDGKIVTDRTFDVVRQLHADCVALQEFVNAPAPTGEPLLEHWARTLGMHAAYAPAFERGGEEFGNALLTRWPLLEQHAHDVSLHGYRRRVVLETLMKVDGVKVQMMSLHLGVSPRERALQAQRMFELCSATRGDLHVLLGDFNEWSRFSAVSRRLRAHFDGTRRLATFPSWAPVGRARPRMGVPARPFARGARGRVAGRARSRRTICRSSRRSTCNRSSSQ